MVELHRRRHPREEAMIYLFSMIASSLAAAMWHRRGAVNIAISLFMLAVAGANAVYVAAWLGVTP